MVKPHRDVFSVSVAEKLGWFKAVCWNGELSRQSRLALQELLEGTLELERESQLQAGPYERSAGRRDWRNGFYERQLTTEFGLIEALRVPRSREGAYQSQVLPRYQRRTPAVEEFIREVFIHGVSTRNVGPILELLTGASVSATTVSQVTQALEARARAYHNRPLEDAYRYLLLDGIRLRCKGAEGPRRAVLLVAYGIRGDGVREVIDFRPARGESEAAWTAFLEQLRRRGLTGHRLRLVTTDGAAGLIAALDMVYPYVPRQRCWVHKLRNVAQRLRQADKEPCLAEAKTIYQALTLREARQRFRAWVRHWHERAPTAVACLTEHIDDLLAVFELPLPHRRKVRTTNPIERAFREVRRRTNPMSCFNNLASIDRIVYAVVASLNHRWEHKPLRAITQDT